MKRTFHCSIKLEIGLDHPRSVRWMTEGLSDDPFERDEQLEALGWALEEAIRISREGQGPARTTRVM